MPSMTLCTIIRTTGIEAVCGGLSSIPLFITKYYFSFHKERSSGSSYTGAAKALFTSFVSIQQKLILDRPIHFKLLVKRGCQDGYCNHTVQQP